MHKVDNRSKRIIRSLKKEINKQRMAEEEFDLYGFGRNKDDLEWYFNKKMKVFYLNEKKQVNFHV